jgi:hypothetical protein
MLCSGQGIIGEIKIAASKVLGAPVISIGPGSGPINHAELTRNAAEILRKQGVAADLSSARLVCYAFPRIGLMVTIPATGSGTDKHMVIDVYDYSIIPASEQTSFYGTLSSSTMISGVTQWNADVSNTNKTTALSISPRATVSKTLSGFTLYPQQGTNWCAFASVTVRPVSAANSSGSQPGSTPRFPRSAPTPFNEGIMVLAIGITSLIGIYGWNRR